MIHAHPPESTDQLAWSPDSHCLALDGVRGFAIFIVTLYRLCKELDPNSHPLIATIRRFAPLGERGVDLFFVLSGFLITGILIRSKGKSHYFRNFIVRRALRIFPLYFLSLAIGLWLIPQLSNTQVFDGAHSDQFYLWTYTSNIRMSWLNEWCFGPFDHFWSLAVEEHFYFVWPALVLLLPVQRLVVVCIGTTFVVAVTRMFASMMPSFDVAVDVLTVFRVDALSMGAMLAMTLTTSINRVHIKRLAIVTVMALLPLLFGIALTRQRLLGLPNSLCPLFFLAGMAILLLSSKQTMLVKCFESSPLRLLGKYSYGMYVVQLPLVTLLPLSTCEGWLPSNPIAYSILYISGMFGLITFVAVLSYHLLESHFLRLKKWFP